LREKTICASRPSVETVRVTSDAASTVRLPRSTQPTRHFGSAATRILIWLATILLGVALATASLGLFYHSAPQLVQAGAFAGTSFPVRAIEHENNPVSSKGLVQVTCAGRAKSLSACWVSRRARVAGNHG
jgi:hypothetical protein